MRYLFTLVLLCIFVVSHSNAQHVEPSKTLIPPHLYLTKVNGSANVGETLARPPATGTCTDTVQFAMERNTGLRGISLHPLTSAIAMGQYYDAPQPMTISGFDFYAWQSDGTDDVISVTCSIFEAGPDSLPTGAALATVNVDVDSSFMGGVLGVIKKSAVFPSPVDVTGPYVLAVTNTDTVNVSVVTNDWEPNDGEGDWFGMAQIGISWLHGYSITIDTFDFDCDLVFEPYISYDLGVDFTISDSCLVSADTIHFTNVSPPDLLASKVYNRHVFNGVPQYAYEWDFGDGSGPSFGMDASHYYSTVSGYPVVLIHVMNGWESVCKVDTMMPLGGPASAGISTSVSGATIIGNPGSSTGATDYYWDFGDGGTSTEENPVYTYAAAGTYTVCLTISNPCAEDSACTSVDVCLPPVADFGYIFASSETVAFTDGSTTSGTISSWDWDFGDGNSSTDQNPVHTYTSSGTFIVCLSVEDDCLNDSECESLDATVNLDQEILAEQIRIWPQPANGELNILWEGQALSRVKLIDLAGQVVKDQIPQSGTSQVKLHAGGLAKGIYILEINSQERIFRKRVLVN